VRANKSSDRASAFAGSAADGHSLPLFIVTKGTVSLRSICDPPFVPASLPSTKTDPSTNLPYEGRYASNENGGATNDMFLVYLKHLCEPGGMLSHCTAERRGLLIVDGHGSHFTWASLKYLKDHHIELILRPPHTTHWLQGEDLIGFALLKPRLTALPKP
jgi:hypothetical protein